MDDYLAQTAATAGDADEAWTAFGGFAANAGFDTVKIAATVPAGARFANGRSHDVMDRTTGEVRPWSTSSWVELRDGIRAKVADHRHSMTVEFSVPRFLGCEPGQLAIAAQVRAAIAEVLDLAGKELGEQVVAAPQLTRVDIARNFIVPEKFDGTLPTLGHQLGLSVDRDPRTRGVTVHGGRGTETSFRLYDKTSESDLPIIEGMLLWRFEVQFRRRPLGRHHLNDPATLVLKDALAAALQIFHRERFDAPVVTQKMALRTLLKHQVEAGAKDMVQTVGHQWFKELGLPSGHDAGTVRKYKARAIEIGLGSVITFAAEAFRLDWASGQVVTDSKPEIDN